MVKLLTNDGKELEVDYKYLVNMKLVNALLGVEDGAFKEMEETEIVEINEKSIPLDDIDMITLKKIVERVLNFKEIGGSSFTSFELVVLHSKHLTTP